MTDIILEVLRSLVVMSIVIFIFHHNQREEIRQQPGWNSIKWGFSLILFATLIDITDNFPQLNHFILIGDTAYEAFLEKVVGYLTGFVLLAYGLRRWLPTVAELGEARKALEQTNATLEERVSLRTKELSDEIEARKVIEKKNCELIADLEKSISEIKELQGILPICSYCKQIRDDAGYWQKLETYISQHSHAEFSHGICPNCIKLHHPEFAKTVLERTSKFTPVK